MDNRQNVAQLSRTTPAGRADAPQESSTVGQHPWLPRLLRPSSLLGLALVIALLGVAWLALPKGSSASGAIPTFSILSVTRDQTVTIQTANFPANDTFEVLMGAMGSRGIGGTRVGTTESGSGGAFQATYSIPAALQGSYQIAIRLQSTTGSGYYAYNWFYNNTTGASAPAPPAPAPGTGYSGYPTFAIKAVTRDQTVTILTNNLPPSDSFDVLMGAMGTYGINGVKVATTDSGSGGAQEFSYTIPAALQGAYQIAIRLQSNTGSGYFAYNWFYNNTTGTGAPATPAPTPAPGSGYSGYPTFAIGAVVRDEIVTILTSNLPPDDTFDVLMGPMGTRGVGGVKVATTSSGAGGAQQFTYSIPSQHYGSRQIAIRLQSNTGSGYYAYNWFYNNTTP